MERSTANRVLEILSSEVVLSEFQISSTFLDDIATQMNQTQGDTYNSIKDFQVSSGLIKEDDYVKLASNWGIKLDYKTSPFISIPGSLTYTKESFFIGDNDPNSTLAGCIFDNNLNFKGSVGVKGNDTVNGQVVGVNDFKYSSLSKCYYLVDTESDVVQVYKDSDKTFDVSLTDVNTPMCICVGSNGFLYVLSQKGIPTDGTINSGFVTVFSSQHDVMSQALYQGKTNGSGTCFAGEIALAKDMFLVTEAGVDKLYILNGNNEIGVFNTRTWVCENVFNIPTSMGTGISANKITLDDNCIYLTSAETGQIIAIDKNTGTFVGKFGNLADESSSKSKKSLGNFNGLIGICVKGNQIFTVESTNRRLQAYGKELLKENSFYVLYDAFYFPNHKHLYKVCSSIQGDTIKNAKIVDREGDATSELSIETAVDRNVRGFNVKVYLDPSQFNMDNKTVRIDPIFILTKEFK